MISTSSLSAISHLASNPLIDRGNPIKKKKREEGQSEKANLVHRERKRKHAWSSVGADVPRGLAKPWFPGDHVADEDCPHV